MIAAIDCDLRKMYAVRSDGVVLFKAVDTIPPTAFDGCETILFEIASALDYTDNKAIAHHKRRWTIWNVARAAQIDMWLRNVAHMTMLVSPSHVWTKGYSLEQRHALARCKQPQKDLRECEAMIDFHRRDSAPWVTLPAYLENL